MTNIRMDGLKSFKTRTSRISSRRDDIIKRDLGQFGEHGTDVIRGLAPRDTGELEESISPTRVKRTQTGYNISVGTNKEYAVPVHEMPVQNYGYRDKYKDGVKYKNYYINGRGRETLRKAKVAGFRPGRKFMTNGVTALESDWKQLQPRILKQLLGGR